jgi:transcriptional regulator with XRE-family HTH domain
MIRRLRVEKGHTQEGLARNLGVATRTVQRWEHGDSFPQGNHLLRLAEVLHVPASSFMKEL